MNLFIIWPNSQSSWSTQAKLQLTEGIKQNWKNAYIVSAGCEPTNRARELLTQKMFCILEIFLTPVLIGVTVFIFTMKKLKE